MATGATGQLGLALPVQGELSGTWGDTVNNGITQYTNIAIAGTLTLTGDGAVTLANTTGDASASNITSTLAGAGTVTAQFSTVRVSGTTTTKVVTGPSYSKSYLIDNASSYAVTFKASGQTGVSISPGEKVYVYYNATDYVKVGGGGITYGAVKTTTYTAVSNDGVLTNTTSGAFTVNLPATPSTGTQVFIADSAGTWGTNNLTIGRNGSTIAGSATDLVCDINSVSIQCIYDGTTWDIFAQIGANDTAVVTLNGTQTLTNKTLTSPTITGTGAIAAATVTLSSTLSVTGVSTLTGGAVIQGLTVGRGAGAVSSNTVVGASAFTTNTTGATNVAVGAFSLGVNSTGNDNTAVGYGTGFYITGSGNTGVGRSALSSGNSGASGSANTAVGFYALQANTSGNYGTSIGYQSGYSSLTSDYNTFLGYRAGYSTTGDQNTFLGKFAGNAITSGATNTIVGAYNGNQASLDIRTASNYTVISDGGGTPHLAAYAGGTVALQGAIPVAGTGITFPATQSASSNANTLDDYEEGTWTPNSGGTATYTTQNGTYTKIGNKVTVHFVFQVNLILTGSANSILGLPFTASASAGSQSGHMSYATGLTSNQIFIGGYVSASGTTFATTSSGAAASSITTNNIIGNGTLLIGDITYFV